MVADIHKNTDSYPSLYQITVHSVLLDLGRNLLFMKHGSIHSNGKDAPMQGFNIWVAWDVDGRIFEFGPQQNEAIDGNSLPNEGSEDRSSISMHWIYVC